MMHSSALLRNSAADAVTMVSGSIDKRSCGGVAMRQRRGVQFGEASEGSFLGQTVKSSVHTSGARSTARRSVVEATSTFESKTKVALVRIGTRGRLVLMFGCFLA